MRIADGRLVAFFSFDIGYEIDLTLLRSVNPAATQAEGATPRRVAPTRVSYHAPPLVLPCAERRVMLGERALVAETSLRVHEFGTVTVVFGLPFPTERWEDLPVLTAALTARGTLEADARSVLQEAFVRLRPAVARPDPRGHGLVEDYYVLQVTRFDPPVDAAALLGAHRDVLARIVHCEPDELSATETDEVLQTAVTYGPRDLVVTDWNVALVVDEDFEDALNVLELLNAQLLELRYLDAMLDRRIGGLYEHVARGRRLFAFRRETERTRELSELRLDTAALRERMINALKLFGNLYLTKIHARTTDRLHLAEWQRSVDGKLELIQKISDVFADRAATARAELLELTIILLIVIEIVLAFFVR